MAAKFDVQVLKKNLFWILLGVAALFELILLVILPLSDPGAEKRKDYEETLKTTKGLTSGWKNEKFLPAWDVRKTSTRKRRIPPGPRHGTLRAVIRPTRFITALPA